jgi:lipoprotein-anchoring transpeptidase ErfK/SrfK
VALPVHRVPAEVTQDQLAAKYPTYLTVDLASTTVRLWQNLKLVKSYTVAVGQPAYPTPTGLYSIESKQVDPVWSVPNSPWAGELAGTTVAGGSAENPLRARWMGVTAGAGFHGTDDVGSLGTAASHGCLRMSVPDVIDLYDRVDVGTPVYIG